MTIFSELSQAGTGIALYLLTCGGTAPPRCKFSEDYLMTNLVINDLDHSVELDRSAGQAVCGGAFSDMFSWDEIFSSINNGNVNSNVGVVSSGNILSPTVVTNLSLYLPVNTVVQLGLDNIIDTETIIASNFGGGADAPG